MVPEDLRYTPEHEWVLLCEEGTVRVGVTDYAQTQLGDVVYIQLPRLGDSVAAGQPVGEIESTKSVSDVYAPLAGTVTARNDALVDAPELVNRDPYGDGWMVEIEMTDPAALQALLDAAGYEKLINQS
jgi:glycine cleavage system H protein